jgi:hypothetical protein
MQTRLNLFGLRRRPAAHWQCLQKADTLGDHARPPAASAYHLLFDAMGIYMPDGKTSSSECSVLA